MSLMEIHLYFIGIPVLLVTVLSVLIWSQKGPRPATYTMSEPWTHPPILWAATGEAVGDPPGHGTTELTVGGGASGTW